MISNIKLTKNDDGGVAIEYDSDVVQSEISEVFVLFGATSAYENGKAEGTSTGVGASGSGSHCITAIDASLVPASFHYQCAVAPFDGDPDQSTDQSYPSNNGGTATTPSVGNVSQTGALVTWNSSDMAAGTVLYTGPDGKTWQQPDDADGSSTSHSATLSDLMPGSSYSIQAQTDFDDDSLPTVTSGSFNFSTQAGDPPVNPPGHVQEGASPSAVKIGASSTITVQVLKHDGTPQAGVPVAFSLGGGQAQGTLSADSGATDAKGLCSTTFSATGLPGKRKKAHRFVVAMSGAAGGKQKRRRAMVLVTKS